MKVKINYGPGRSIEIENGNASTIGQVLNDPDVQAALGVNPQKVEADIDGVTQGQDAPVADGDEINLRSKAHEKGLLV